MSLTPKAIAVFICLISMSLWAQKSETNISEKYADEDYQLVWSDEFEAKDVDLSNWSFEIWDAGKVNNEWQQYVEDKKNYKIEDGKLCLTVTKTGANKKGGYTSTRLSSASKKEFKYGRIEFRAKLPHGVGTWPALWMLGANHDQVGWPKCGEIDIMEYVGFQPDTVHSNVHTQYQHGVTDFHKEEGLESAEESFHTYGISWDADSIKFYVDDPDNIVNVYAPEVKTKDNWPFDQPFFLIMNFAVGGAWGGKKGVDENIWPQSMVVDYVRVYQKK